MKILFLVATYYPNVDGVQKVTQYQAEGLAKMGHNVIVITSDLHKDIPREEQLNGVKIIRMKVYNKNMFHFGEKRQFQKKVMALSKDVDAIVAVSAESFSSAWILTIMEQLDCKVILYSHGMHSFKWNKNNISTPKEFIKKLLRDIRWGAHYLINWKNYQKFDGVCFLHEKDDAYIFFNKHHYRGKKEIIYNAADDIFFKEGVEKKRQIINVGTFHNRKNQKLALEVFYEANMLDYKLILIGNPQNEYYNELIAYNDELKGKHPGLDVQIICDLDRESTVKYIRESSIYLQTSSWEAFPVSLVESISSGSAFVSTDVGIVNEIPGGIICRSKDELVSALRKMESCWKEYAQCGRAYAVSHFKQSIEVEKLESLIGGV